jgi:hypothetical protein
MMIWWLLTVPRMEKSPLIDFLRKKFTTITNQHIFSRPVMGVSSGGPCYPHFSGYDKSQVGRRRILKCKQQELFEVLAQASSIDKLPEEAPSFLVSSFRRERFRSVYAAAHNFISPPCWNRNRSPNIHKIVRI